MSRTAEQVAADDALTAAIVAVDRAYNGHGQDDILIEYVVCAAWQRMSEEGDVEDGTSTIGKDGGIPGYRQRGLLLDSVAAMNALLVVGIGDDGE